MLGLCCQFLTSKIKKDGTIVYENAIDEKHLQLGAYKNGKYSESRIRDTYINNVDQHINIIPSLLQNNIKVFRLTSGLFPLFEFCGDTAKSDKVIVEKLAHLGKLFKDNGIRVTCHPGQFCVISSDSDKTIQNSVRELEYHAWVFDAMGLDRTPYYAINIHGGKKDRTEKILEVFQSLPENVKKRLTLENDEKCYNVKELLKIHDHLSIPVVFDSHHYTFGRDDLGVEDAFNGCVRSWGAIKPLQHISNTEVGMENASYNQKRSHSQMIRYAPENQLQAMREDTIDVDVEAKMKNIALLKMRQDFDIKN
jgi:UV DNA damage endonuclease